MSQSELNTTLNMLLHHMSNPAMTGGAARKLHDLVTQVSSSKTADRDRIPGIHPSTLSRCTRMAWMEMRGVPRLLVEIPEVVRKAGILGKAIHSLIQDDYEQYSKHHSAAFEYQREVPIDPKKSADAARYMLRGNADGILWFKAHNIKLGQEIKTVSPDKHNRLVGPLEDHLLQASVYQHCLGLDAMWFLYVDRGTMSIKHYPVVIPDSYRQTMLSRAAKILEYELNDKAPPGTVDAYSCRACAYSPVCPEPRGKVIESSEVWECLKNASQ